MGEHRGVVNETDETSTYSPRAQTDVKHPDAEKSAQQSRFQSGFKYPLRGVNAF